MESVWSEHVSLRCYMYIGRKVQKATDRNAQLRFRGEAWATGIDLGVVNTYVVIEAMGVNEVGWEEVVD